MKCSSTMNNSLCMERTFRGIYTRRLLRALSRIDGPSRDKEEELTIVKRMRRIKAAADLSLALTAQGTAWSRAQTAKSILQLKRDKHLVKEIVGSKRFNGMVRIKRLNAYYYKHRLLSYHGLAGRMIKYMGAPLILSRNSINRSIHRKNPVKFPFRSCAYSVPNESVLNRRKLRQLRSVIPGGESMNDSACLLKEAADYIFSLRTQVQVMHSLAYQTATQPL